MVSFVNSKVASKHMSEIRLFMETGKVNSWITMTIISVLKVVTSFIKKNILTKVVFSEEHFSGCLS